MNDPAPPANHTRDALRARIDAAERRNAERTLADSAREAAAAASDYTRAHPLAVTGGALALGLAVGLMTRPGRTAARRAATGVSDAASSARARLRGVDTKEPSRIAALVSDAVIAYLTTLAADAKNAGKTAQDGADVASLSGANALRNAARQGSAALGKAADNSRLAASKTRYGAENIIRDLLQGVRR